LSGAPNAVPTALTHLYDSRISATRPLLCIDFTKLRLVASVGSMHVRGFTPGGVRAIIRFSQWKNVAEDAWKSPNAPRQFFHKRNAMHLP
jgi:hypothetical protein